MHEGARMARVRGGVRDRLFALLRSVGISASYSICGRFAGSSRTNDFTLGLFSLSSPFSLSGRRCRAHWDILSTAPTHSGVGRERDTPSNLKQS